VLAMPHKTNIDDVESNIGIRKTTNKVMPHLLIEQE
jgi:hypothetical protein